MYGFSSPVRPSASCTVALPIAPSFAATPASARSPISVARTFEGVVAIPCRPPMRSRASAAMSVKIAGARAASSWNCAASMRATREGTGAR